MLVLQSLLLRSHSLSENLFVHPERKGKTYRSPQKFHKNLVKYWRYLVSEGSTFRTGSIRPFPPFPGLFVSIGHVPRARREHTTVEQEEVGSS